MASPSLKVHKRELLSEAVSLLLLMSFQWNKQPSLFLQIRIQCHRQSNKDSAFNRETKFFGSNNFYATCEQPFHQTRWWIHLRETLLLLPLFLNSLRQRRRYVSLSKKQDIKTTCCFCISILLTLSFLFSLISFFLLQQWDDIVYAFCLGVPVKTHRRRLRSYEDCFVAKKAVDWLHEYLSLSPSISKHDITRHQAVQLLRKFVQHDIITRIDGKRGDELYQEFEDNKDLYRLCINESRMVRNQNSMNTMNTLPQHHHHLHIENQENLSICSNFVRSHCLREPSKKKLRRSKSGRSWTSLWFPFFFSNCDHDDDVWYLFLTFQEKQPVFQFLL